MMRCSRLPVAQAGKQHCHMMLHLYTQILAPGTSCRRRQKCVHTCHPALAPSSTVGCVQHLARSITACCPCPVRKLTRRDVRASGTEQLPGSIQSVIEELRRDPQLRPVFESERMQRVLQEVREDPARAMAKYAKDTQVMAVLQRLAVVGLKDTEGLSALLQQLGTTPSDLASSVFSDGQLAARLAQPRIRAAIAEIRADPERAMLKYENDNEVMGVLDALQARLEAQGHVIDV